MTLKDIEYFCIVAKEGNITKAAAGLFIAQPALSQCIKKLESEMGITLLIRSKAGTTLTKEGECFYSFAQRVMNEKKELDVQLQDMRNGERGTVRLGFSGSQASFILPQILPSFQMDHPNIELQLVESLSIETEKRLISREIDLAIIPKPTLLYNFVSFLLLQFATVPLIRVFSQDAELIHVAKRCIQIYFGAYVFMALMQTGQSTFVALNMPKYALFFSVFRKIILIIPLTLILPRTGFGVDGVFYAELFSEVIGATACYTTMLCTVLPRIRKEKEQATAEAQASVSA